MKERIAIVAGLRTPMAKAGGALKDVDADDLGAYVLRQFLSTAPTVVKHIDEVIFGNVSQPAHAANVARVIALKAGLPSSVIAQTVHRNCASGMEAISAAANKILASESDVIIAGGTESMSRIPLYLSAATKELLEQFNKAKTIQEKLRILSRMRLHHLKPIVGVMLGLTDPVCGLNMGQTAEVLAKEFHVTRQEQDAFALASHQKALKARERGIFYEEMVPLPVGPRYETVLEHDDGPRVGQSLEQLQKLKPYFDRLNGTVTVGNACPLTDGAAVVLLMKERKAKELGLTPLGYLRAYAYAGLEPQRMGLGPVYATAKVLRKTGLRMRDFSLMEINEAFAAQVLACVKAFGSTSFAQKYLGQGEAVGDVDMNILNVNGGAIALGHPVGMTGTRLVLTLLREMHRREASLGLASLCIGGGQGAAMVLEVE